MYGSEALGASIPSMSDIDIVIQIQSSSAKDDGILRHNTGILKAVRDRLSYLHEKARPRYRISSSSGTALLLLTVTLGLGPNHPSVDVMICRIDSAGKCVDAADQRAMDSVKETEDIKLAVIELHTEGMEIFQGALRILKMWAYRRQVYGASAGYLGGGGWAILLLWVWQQDCEATGIKVRKK